MTDVTDLGEINQRIATIRGNLRALTDQAAARSGAADEDLAADRITSQEEQLASLVKLRDSLSSLKS
jgi:predicted  nucleic acid-binding Zn-ribbon protein